MADDTQLSRLITLHDIKGIKKFLYESENLDMNYRDIMYDLQTPLMRLCHLTLPEDEILTLFELMTSRAFDINIKDGSGRTLLSHACFAQNNTMIEKLGSCKQFYCNPNIEDDDGCTALFYAIKTRNPTVVATLLDCFLGIGLDINHKDFQGVSALEVAESKSDREICHLLKSKGKASLNGNDCSLPNLRALKQNRSITPKSSRRSKNKQKCSNNKKKQELSPLIVPQRDNSSVKHMTKSCESLKSNNSNYYDDEVFDNNESECYKHVHPLPSGLTPRERENSFSLPDLRTNSGSLVSSTPSSASLMSDFSFKNVSTAAINEGNEQELTEELEDLAKSFDSNTFRKKKKRKNSLSLPELRLDNQNGQKNGHSRRSDKENSPTTTPRINVMHSSRGNKNIHYSIDSSVSSFMSKSNGSLSSRKSKCKDLNDTSLTLPQIDTTPRAGFPNLDTDRSRRGNSTNRGLKGLKNYDALVS